MKVEDAQKINLRVPQPMNDKLETMAKNYSVPKNSVINIILTDFFNQECHKSGTLSEKMAAAKQPRA